MFTIVLFLGWILNGGREITVSQGGVTLVPISVKVSEYANSLSARLSTFRVPMVVHNDSLFVLVSADIEMKEGKYLLRLYANTKLLDSNMVLVKKVYFPEKIYGRSYKDTAKVITHTDSVAMLAAILKWRRYKNTLSSYTSARYATIDRLVDPLSNIFVTGLFGKHRIFTDRKYFHGGADLRAPLGTEVFSIAKSKVIWAEDDTLPGNGVCIVSDLGGGIRIFSLHLSEITVKTGDTISRGQLVGFSGSTGASELHLHFEIHCGQARVDPFKFLEIFRR